MPIMFRSQFFSNETDFSLKSREMIYKLYLSIGTCNHYCLENFIILTYRSNTKGTSFSLGFLISVAGWL